MEMTPELEEWLEQVMITQSQKVLDELYSKEREADEAKRIAHVAMGYVERVPLILRAIEEHLMPTDRETVDLKVLYDMFFNENCLYNILGAYFLHSLDEMRAATSPDVNPNLLDALRGILGATEESFLKSVAQKMKDAPAEYIPEIIIETKSSDKRKKAYRTRKKAEESVKSLLPLPSHIAIPTSPGFENSLSFYQQGKAYMVLTDILDGADVLQVERLKFVNGVLYFDGLRFSEALLKKHIKDKEGIENINLPLLQFYFSAILERFKNMLKNGEIDIDAKSFPILPVTFFVPDLIAKLGERFKFNEEEAEKIGNGTFAFQSLIGVMKSTRYPSFYPVLLFRGYNGDNNTISFESPYLEYLIREIYKNSVMTDKKGNLKLKKDNTPKLTPSYSYLLKPELMSERNKAAVENVRIIVTVIEQAGSKGTPHIRAETLIERNQAFKQRLENNAKPNRLLERVFKKTWELLREQTKLLDTYRDIKLPSPDNSTHIPTMSTLDTVFEFPHKGKK